VAPAAAARQWTDRLGRMVFLAAGFGALAGVSGAVLSSDVRDLPTGPAIVLSAGLLVLVSLLLAPNRGLLWNRLRQFQHRRALRLEAVLHDLQSLAAQHDNAEHAHSLAVLQAMHGGEVNVKPVLRALEQRGWVRRVGSDHWALTPEGRAEAEGQGQSPEASP
jgi:manganese/zinc/iron transport system permease protein